MTTGRINQVAVRRKSRRTPDCSDGPVTNLESAGATSPGPLTRGTSPCDIRQLSHPSVLFRLSREKHSHGEWSQTGSYTDSLYTALQQADSNAIGFSGIRLSSQVERKLSRLQEQQRTAVTILLNFPSMFRQEYPSFPASRGGVLLV